MGEGLPFWLNRFDDHARFPMQARGLKRTPRQYLTENLVITCSGNFSIPAFLCAVMEMGIDNVLFSVDWPYESNKVGVEFLKRVPLADADKEKIRARQRRTHPQALRPSPQPPGMVPGGSVRQ